MHRSDNLTTLQPKEHRHTLFFIHGLNEHREDHLQKVINALGPKAPFTRIVLPQAPQRFVTFMNKETTSWFDIKFRSEKSFTVPFDEAFSSAEVHNSFEL